VQAVQKDQLEKVARQEVTARLVHQEWPDKQAAKDVVVCQVRLDQLESLAKLSLHQAQQVRKEPRDQKEKKAPLDHQPRKEAAKLVQQVKQETQATKARLAKKAPPDQKDPLANLVQTVAARSAHHLVCLLAFKLVRNEQATIRSVVW